MCIYIYIHILDTSFAPVVFVARRASLVVAARFASRRAYLRTTLASRIARFRIARVRTYIANAHMHSHRHDSP